MNAIRDPDADAQREQHTAQFLGRALDEVEQMRRCVPQLIKGDVATWQEVRFCAKRLATDAQCLDMGILAACARELAALTDEKFAGANLNEHFLVTISTGIEAVALELNALTAQRRGG